MSAGAGIACPTGAGSILLVRHGQTDDNLEPIRIQGFRDTPLNETGRRQARELAGQLQEATVGSLWSSDLIRARETADIIGARIGLEPRLDPRLREGNRGAWEGRLWLEIERELPAAYEAWRRAGAEFRFPDGESLSELAQRVEEALEDIGNSGRLPALVVTHGGAIRCALCTRDGRGLEAFHEFEVPNVGVVRL